MEGLWNPGLEKSLSTHGMVSCCGTWAENLRAVQAEVWLVKFQGEAKTLSGSFDILIKNCGSGQLGLKKLAMTDMSPATLKQTLCFTVTIECWLA